MATVPVAQSTPSKPVQSAPKPRVTVPEQGEISVLEASVPEPSATVQPTEPTNIKVGLTVLIIHKIH